MGVSDLYEHFPWNHPAPYKQHTAGPGRIKKNPEFDLIEIKKIRFVSPISGN